MNKSIANQRIKNITVDSVRSALEGRRGEWRIICDQSGIDYSWLTKFGQGKIQHPGFDKMKKLIAFL